MIEGSTDEEGAAFSSHNMAGCSGSRGVCRVHGRRLKCEFIREKSPEVGLTPSTQKAAEATGAFWVPCPPPFATVSFCLLSSAASPSPQTGSVQEGVTEKQSKVVCQGLLVAGSNSRQVTRTHHIWVPDLISTQPIEGLACEPDIPQFLVTLVASILINHQLYFKHLLLFPQIFKMEFLSA